MGGILVLASACTKGGKTDSPEAVLEAYVKKAINAKSGSDKGALYDYTTGKALERLQQMSDEDFINSLVKPEFKFVHFSTRDRRQEEDGSVNLVYELVYDSAGGDTSAKVTNRKIAYFKNVDGKWKIEDTRNVKSFVEVEKGMEVKFP